MKRSTLCAFAILAVGTISCNMAFCTTHYPAASALTVTASAAEASGNLIVQITGLPELSGVTVTVTGNEKTYTAVTNEKGQAVFSKLPVYDSAGTEIAYTIREDIPEGYLATTYTVKLAAYNTLIATIPYTKKTYSIAIDCKDYITNSILPSGDAVLSGGSFTVYHDGAVYGTYSIDEDGKLCEFALYGMEYEGTWEIQMNEAPAGYFLDPTMQELGYMDGDTWTSLTSFFPQYTHATMHLSLLPISGKLSVTGNAGDTVQIYLESAGSYENCRASERAQLTMTDAGKAVETELLPYGRYVISDLTTGKNMTADISTYGEIVPVTLEQSDVTEKTTYYLYNIRGDELIQSGEFTEGSPIALPDGHTADTHYMLRIKQTDPDSGVETLLKEMYIILHKDGTYTEDYMVLCGDVNLDGRVDLSDAILLNKYCSGAVKLSKEQIAAGNCDTDSQTDMNDSIALLRFLVHLETKLPVTEQGEERV